MVYAAIIVCPLSCEARPSVDPSLSKSWAHGNVSDLRLTVCMISARNVVVHGTDYNAGDFQKGTLALEASALNTPQVVQAIDTPRLS